MIGAVPRSRSGIRRGLALALCGLSVSALGCADENWLIEGVTQPPIVWTGEHVRIGTDLELEDWCPGTLDRLDGYTGELKELFSAPEEQVIGYYLFEYPLPMGTGSCRDAKDGCAYDGPDEVFLMTAHLPFEHEVVHTVGARQRKLPSFFEEGAATYWSDPAVFPDARLAIRDVRTVLDERWDLVDGQEDRVLGAHFTSFLVHRWGMERYVELLHTKAPSREQFEPAFAQIFGMSLDEAIDEYETIYDPQSYCTLETFRSSFYECGREPEYILDGSGEVEFDIDLSCANPDVVGPRTDGGGPPRIWQDMTIEVDGPVGPDGKTNGYVEFDEPAPGEPSTVSVEIKACDTDCYEVASNRWILEPNRDPDVVDFFTFRLRPGRYVMRVSRAADDPGTVRFRWE